MGERVWEGRSVWAKGRDEDDSGWIEVQEANADSVRLIVRTHGTAKSVGMSREQAKTLAAQMMNLARREG